MKYYQLVKNAKEKNIWNEKTMWLSVQCISTFIDEIKEYNIDLYWNFMREQTGILNNYHYDKCWAEHDVSQMEYTNKQGEKRQGAYWTVEQLKEATKEYKFPSGVTEWDIFVAFNAMHADTCKKLDDKQILDAAYFFFFNDEDWDKSGKSATKIWHYMQCKYNNG